MSATSRPAPPPPSFITAAENREKKTVKPPKATYQEEISGINVARVDRNINESLRKQIVDIINKHPDLALSIIRSWNDRKR